MESKTGNQNGRGQSERRPYAMLGSGRLMLALFKAGNESVGWRYRFNLFRLDQTNGHVSQWFNPCDLAAMPKLVRLLAFELCEDGCLSTELRTELKSLVSRLDDALGDPTDADVTREFTTHERRSLVEVVEYLTQFSGHVVTGNGAISWHVAQLREWLDRSTPEAWNEE